MDTNVIALTDNFFFKSMAAHVIGQYFNSQEKLCDIIETKYPKLSLPSKEVLMDMCESAIPLMIRLDRLNKEKQNEQAN